MIPLFVIGGALLAVVIDQAGDTAEQVGDAVEQTGNASLKFAILSLICIGGYMVYIKTKKRG